MGVMSTSSPLVRPASGESVERGNDGLTDRERETLAARHRSGAGSPVLSSAEKRALAKWREAR